MFGDIGPKLRSGINFHIQNVQGFLSTLFGGTGTSNTPVDGHILIGSTANANYSDSQLTSTGNTLTITKGSGTLNADLSPISAHTLIVGTGTTGYNVVAPSGTAGTALVSAGGTSDPTYGAVALGAGGTVSGVLPAANGGSLVSATATTSFTAVAGNAYLVTLSGAANCTLPTAVGIAGQTLSVTLLANGFTLSFLTTSSQTINNQVTFINGLAQVGQAYTFVSDGSNWWTSDFAPGNAGLNAVFVSGGSGNIGWQTPLNVAHGGTGVTTGALTGLTGDVTTTQSTTGNVATFDYGQTHVITPSISSDQNDWSPTGWLTSSLPVANVIRVTATAYVDITGLAAPTYNVGTSGTAEGCRVTIQVAAASTFPVRIVANSGSSMSANQFNTPSNIYLGAGEGVTLIYDNTAGNWRAYDNIKDVENDYFGSGKDGNVTASTGSITRDMYYENLTIPASTVVTTNGFKIFVNGMLDISAASAGSIVENGNAGTSASGSGLGTGGIIAAVGTNPTLPGGLTAPNGVSGTNSSGANGNAASRSTAGSLNNGAAATSGNGGTGTNGGGNGAVAPNSGTQAPYLYKFVDFLGYGIIPITVGASGSGGAAGGGSGSTAGGGGGGGGSVAGCLYLSARFINKGSSTTASIIQTIGGGGGNGGNGSSGVTGGGGGGSGGQGGTMFVYYNMLFGSVITGCLDATGGAGGNGGNPTSTGAAGKGGGGGRGGYILSINLRTGVATETIGGAASTTAIQTGATASSTQQNL